MHENNKKLLLEILDEAGSFDYVLRTLKKLMEDIEEQVEKMERVNGKRNEELRALLRRWRFDDRTWKKRTGIKEPCPAKNAI